jgi:hypothetical protein
MTDLKSEIEKILERHKRDFQLDPISSHESDDKNRERIGRQRDFDLMTHNITASIEEEDVEDLIQHIEDKLAYDSLQTIGRYDWWWTPPSVAVTGTLRDVRRALNAATKKKKTVKDRFRKFRWVWWVLRELIYLAIVIGLFSVSTSKFEAVVMAALVLIYSRVAMLGVGLGAIVTYLGHTVEVIYWEFGRRLRLKVPISRLTEAKEPLGDLSVQTLTHSISIGIGTLIALWHIAAALFK